MGKHSKPSPGFGESQPCIFLRVNWSLWFWIARIFQ
jgi:hypothetical protein